MKGTVVLLAMMAAVSGCGPSKRLPTDAERKAAAPILKAHGKSLESCTCGDEQCVSDENTAGFRWRCMAAGAGECVWYRTNEVCPP